MSTMTMASRPHAPYRATSCGGNIHSVSNPTGPARGHRYSIADSTAPADARELVRKHAPAALVDDVATAASELAGNALKHAGGADRITLTVTATMLILSVTDHRPDKTVTRPEPGAAFDLETESGRGLAIICALGFQLAVRRAAASKRVTARIPIGEDQ